MKNNEITEATIDDLHFLDDNPVNHPKQNQNIVKDSVEEFGIIRSITIDEDNTILAGNNTTKQAIESGREKVIIIDTDGDPIIAVRRKGLTEEQKYRYAILDNKSSRTNMWSKEALIAIEAQRGVNLGKVLSDKDIGQIFDKKKKETKETKSPFDDQEQPEGNGEAKFYITIECETKEDQQQMADALSGEGYKVIQFESKF